MIYGSLKNLFILVIFAALCSCSTSRVKVNYNDEIDFLDFKTFAWLEPMNKDKKGYISLGEQAVRKKISDSMNLKGLQKVESDKADILVAINVTQKEKIHYSSSPAFYHSHYRSRWGYSPYWYEPEYYTESTFILAFVNPKTKQALWEGYAKDSSFNEMSEAEVQKIVDAFFNYFPPLPTSDFEGYHKLDKLK